MAVCLLPFERIVSLVRRVLPPTGKWTTIPAVSDILELTHLNPFNVGQTPVAGDFVFKAAGVPVAPLAIVWSDPTHLGAIFPPGTLSDPLTAEFLAETPRYVLAAGPLMDVYGPIVCPDPPWAAKKLKEWLLANPHPVPVGSPSYDTWLSAALIEWRKHL